MHSRRGLVRLVAAAALVPGAALGRPARPVRVNALGSLWNPNLSLGPKTPTRPGGEGLEVDDRAIADARAAGLIAINVTVGSAAGFAVTHAATLTSLDHWDGLVAANPLDLMHVTQVADFERARASGRIGVIYGFQNSAQVGGHLERVDLYAERGVRVVQLTYNDVNMMGGGSSGPEDTPLTALGRGLVERLNAARLMVDLSHSCRQTCLDAVDVSRAPISINHTGCRTLSNLPRNKTDQELRRVASSGGFVGIYFMPFLVLDGHAHATDAAAHIAHALKVCGEDHVGIGTDGTATRIDDMAHFRDLNAKDYSFRVAQGVAAKGEAADVLPFMEDLIGPGQYATVAALLQARGVKARVIDKVMGANFIDYARRVW